MTETITVHLVSKSRDSAKRAGRRVKDYLRKKGYRRASSYVHINSASVSKFTKLVNHDETPENKIDNWITYITPETLELVNKQDGTTIYVTTTSFQARQNLNAATILNEVDIPKSVIAQFESTIADDYSPGQTPFTYDPARDYYTEPDN